MPDHFPWEFEARSDRIIARRLTLAYVCGLLVIGILTAAVHLVFDHVIAQQRDAATIVNVAGRQRMLSQRIALLSGAVRAGDETAREPLQQSVDLMERSQNALIRGGDLGITHSLSPVIHSYYFDGPAALDPLVRTYLADARDFLETGSEEAFQKVRRSARGGLLGALDRAVALFEAEVNGHIDGLRSVQKGLLLILLLALLLEAAFVFRPLVRKVGQTTARLLDLATHDALTGLANRRFFLEAAMETIAWSRRTAQPLSVLMLDLDHFKGINDTFGHATGDAVLQRFAAVLRAHLRSSDLCARLGGEEFVVLLPGSDAASARVVAEKLRQAVEGDRCESLPAVTVSIGIGLLAPPADGIDSLLGRADRALYAAKAAGRNRVCAGLAELPPAVGGPAWSSARGNDTTPERGRG